jgi:hypothetical protein
MRLYEFDRVRSHTDREVQDRIDRQIEESVRFYATQSKGVISFRIAELEKEWDVDRWVDTQVASAGLAGLVLGLTTTKKWFAITGGALLLLLQHALTGNSLPVSALRKAGVRTRSEIDREKFALKALRGDFEQVGPKSDGTEMLRAHDVLRAVGG